MCPLFRVAWSRALWCLRTMAPITFASSGRALKLQRLDPHHCLSQMGTAPQVCLVTASEAGHLPVCLSIISGWEETASTEWYQSERPEPLRRVRAGPSRAEADNAGIEQARPGGHPPWARVPEDQSLVKPDAITSLRLLSCCSAAPPSASRNTPNSPAPSATSSHDPASIRASENTAAGGTFIS